MRIFEEILFFKATYNKTTTTTTNKQTNKQFTYLSGQSRALFLLQKSNWQKISELFASFCTVRSFEKEDFLQNSHPVSFRLITFRVFLYNPGLLCEEYVPTTFNKSNFTAICFAWASKPGDLYSGPVCGKIFTICRA